MYVIEPLVKKLIESARMHDGARELGEHLAKWRQCRQKITMWVLLTYSLTHLLTYSLTHLLSYSLTHLLSYLVT